MTAGSPLADNHWVTPPVAYAAAAGATVLSIAGLVIAPAEVGTAFLAAVTAMIFGVYAGLALSNGTVRDSAVELVFIAAGLCVVGVGLQHGRLWIAAALAAHGSWDLLHHPHRHPLGALHAPTWYVQFCAAYDFTAAAAIAILR